MLWCGTQSRPGPSQQRLITRQWTSTSLRGWCVTECPSTSSPMAGWLWTMDRCVTDCSFSLKPNDCCINLLHGGNFSTSWNRLVGLVVRRPPRERKITGSNPACAGIFSGSSHTSDSKIGTPVAILPGAWCYRVSAWTGRPGVSIL